MAKVAPKVAVEKQGSTTIVAIDRFAEARNAVDPETAVLLREAFLAFDKDDSQSVAILTGRGGTFCAGYDLKSVAGRVTTPIFNPEAPGPMGPSRHLLTKPVIAAVEGYAVAGGLELALWCDLRIATEGSRLGFTERRFGVPLIDGGTQRLPRIVGLGRALDLILSGRVVETDEALALGLVGEVVLPGRHVARALEIAERLAAFPQAAMLADRRAVYDGLGLPLADGLAVEAGNAGATFADAAAGAARFAAGEGRGGAGAGV